MLLFLVYHKIENRAKDNVYSIPCELLVSHLRLVQAAEIKIVDPRSLPGKWLDDQDGLVFTFDDGTLDHFENVLPILREFAIPALFYIPTAKLNMDGYLSQEQVRLLFSEGHTIGSHAHSHQRLDVLPGTSLRAELEHSYAIIYNLIGERPVHFAPPGGFYSCAIQQAAQETGYNFFRTMLWGYNRSFDPRQIEIVPMTGALNYRFLRPALRGEGEGLLKFMSFLKNGLRAMLSGSRYQVLRRGVMNELRRFR